MPIDRKTEPPVEIPEKIQIPRAEKIPMDNSVPCYAVHSPNQDVLKIEFNFNAGFYHESKRLVAGASNDLSDEGTTGKTSREIAAHFDFYGASLQTDCGPDRASITLFTIGKYLLETLPMVKEIILNPVYPEDELRTYATQNKQRLNVSNNKVEFIARKKFAQAIFGAQHPYGYYACETDFDTLNRKDLADFHQTNYTASNLTIISSGNITGQVKRELARHFGTNPVNTEKKAGPHHATISTPDPSLFYTEKPDAIQSAIRIGRRLFNKKHPDYAGMSILSTILGGYFGSRLMSNIREDKGYTYGIGSALVSLQQDGYFFITTEVGAGVTRNTLNEIYFELERLREEPVGREELKTVKNYLIGAFLRSIDGPFAQADKWKGICFYDLDYDYYDQFLETVRNISAGELQNIASKYLNKNDLTEIVVGKK